MSREGISPYAERLIAAGLSEIEARVLNQIAKFNDNATCATVGSSIWVSFAHNCSCPHARPAGAVIARLIKKGYVRRTDDKERVAYGRTYKAKKIEQVT